MLSHPQPELPPPKKPPPNPHPQPSLLSPPLQKQSRIRIQIIELHPQPPDLLLLPQPQFVAVKSLIVLPPKKFYLWFILCAMAWQCFHEKWIVAKIVL